MEKQVITEEMKLHEKWFEEARKQTVETLPEFVRHLIEDYQHDYGTICHAIGAAGIAGMCAVENSPVGGITGFQSRFCMWDVIRQWNFRSNKCGLKLVDYDKLLYPQNQDDFFSIGRKILQSVQQEAKNKIEEYNNATQKWAEDHAAWEKELERFKADVVEWQKEHSEYPTYEENPNFYEHLSCGTSAEWDAEKKKEESGFMFAPEEPCEPSIHPDVMAHWVMLSEGGTPFGLKVED